MNDIRLLELEKREALPEVFFAFQIYKKMFLSLKEAQEYLGIKSFYAFRDKVMRGDIPAFEESKKTYKISLLQLDRYLKNNLNNYYERR